MNQYDVTNSQNGMVFQAFGDVLPAPQPPEWGKNPTIVTTNIDAQIAAKATAAVARNQRLARLQAFTASSVFASLSPAQQSFLQDLADHLLGR